VARVIPERRPPRRRVPGSALSILVLVALAVAVVALARCLRTDHASSGPSPTWTPGASATAPSPTDSAAFDGARAALAALPVKGWDRTQDFKRYRFGKAWSDDVNVEFGHNGCNTRDDILRRDLSDLEVRRGTCYAERGTLHDPYTGTVIAFVRGPDTSNAVEIDHVVSLADAWYKGAREWDVQRRLDFANDPRNLLAVSPSQLRQGIPGRGVVAPPMRGSAARSSPVRSRSRAYGLWVSAKEKQAMADVLDRC
jgi:hypothetical protein